MAAAGTMGDRARVRSKRAADAGKFRRDIAVAASVG